MAVIITIMVLEFKVPADATVASIVALVPSFLVYALSFLVVAIMWVNHHYLMRTAKRADAPLLWSNNTLLFWMSLIPFATGYMGRNHLESVAVAVYGAVLTFTTGSFLLLMIVLANHNSNDPVQRSDHHRGLRKSVFSISLYAMSTGLAFVSVYLSFAIFVLIPLLYFIPDRRLRAMSASE